MFSRDKYWEALNIRGCNMLVLSLFISISWRPPVATVTMAAKEDVRVDRQVHPLRVAFTWKTASAKSKKKKVWWEWNNQNRRRVMVDFCPKCIHIVPVTTARKCSGWKGVGGGRRRGGVRFSTALHHRQEGQKPPLSVPTFLGPKGFYRPADSNAGTIITSYWYYLSCSPLSLPAFFSPHGAFSAPHHAKETHTKKTSSKKKKKKDSFWCKLLGAKYKTSDKTRSNKWTQPWGSKGNKLRFGGATWINFGAKRIFVFFTLINRSSCHHRRIW